MTWKLIDLAPRDGTLILACALPEGADAWTAAEIWAAPKAVSWRPYRMGAGMGRSTWRDAKGLACRPTHFMEMPDPPLEELVQSDGRAASIVGSLCR